jgi:hypothetical protein
MDFMLVLIGILLCLVLWLVWNAIMPKVENPPFKVRKKLDAGIEIREYGKLVIAKAIAKSKRPEDSAFSIIAGYIFGANEKGQKIAMTAPVTTSTGESGLEMFFVMPQGYSIKNLPRPGDRRVELSEMPGRVMAVIGFSGYANYDAVKKNEMKLISVLKDSKIMTKGRPFLMQYNPPWTPPIMRKNEIGVELDNAQST